MTDFNWQAYDNFPARCGNCQHWDYDYGMTRGIDCKFVEFHPCKVNGAEADFVGPGPHILLLSAESHCLDHACAFEPTDICVADFKDKLREDEAWEEYKRNFDPNDRSMEPWRAA